MYLFFDTETTGLPRSWKAPVTDLSNWPRLVQLAWLSYDAEGNEIGSGDLIVTPDGFEIPPDAARVHGITTARAERDGVPLRAVLSQFAAEIERAKTLVAHNMSFDEKIVGAEFLRTGNKHILTEKKLICTMEGAKEFCGLMGPYGLKWPKLSELHKKLFNEDFADAHNAANDIRATARCFWELRARGVL
jgi:DNA polymerase III epsilon subunit-like protein